MRRNTPPPPGGDYEYRRPPQSGYGRDRPADDYGPPRGETPPPMQRGRSRTPPGYGRGSWQEGDRGYGRPRTPPLPYADRAPYSSNGPPSYISGLTEGRGPLPPRRRSRSPGPYRPRSPPPMDGRGRSPPPLMRRGGSPPPRPCKFGNDCFHPYCRFSHPPDRDIEANIVKKFGSRENAPVHIPRGNHEPGPRYSERPPPPRQDYRDDPYARDRGPPPPRADDYRSSRGPPPGSYQDRPPYPSDAPPSRGGPWDGPGYERDRPPPPRDMRDPSFDSRDRPMERGYPPRGPPPDRERERLPDPREIRERDEWAARGREEDPALRRKGPPPVDTRPNPTQVQDDERYRSSRFGNIA